MSRAVGETMVVLIAGGQQPQWGADIGKSMETLTAFIGATAKGDAATGSIALQDDLRRRHDPVRDHARDEPDLDPLRPQVQAGVRMSAHQDAIGQAARPRSASRTAPSASRCSPASRWRSACSSCCSWTWPWTARARSTGTSSTASRRSRADKAGIQAALWGTIWLMGVCALFIVPVGVATAIYLEEYGDPTKWWNRLIELNIQNLAAVPSIVYGILGLAFLVRGPLEPRQRGAGRRTHARPAGAAHGDHRRARGAARGAARRSARAPWRSEPRSGRPSGARCCPRRYRASPLE